MTIGSVLALAFDAGASGSKSSEMADRKTSVAVPGTLVPVDQAFPIRALRSDGRLVLRFDVLPGHYLYRDRFEAAVQGKETSLGRLPAGTPREDAFFGKVSVYDQPVEIGVALPAPVLAGEPAVVSVRYQGCSERAGVCYPPVTRAFKITADRVEPIPSEAPRPGVGSLLRPPPKP